MSSAFAVGSQGLNRFVGVGGGLGRLPAVTAPDLPVFALDLHVVADHGQIYIYSEAALDQENDDLYEDAFDDATDNERFVGTGGGLVVLVTPGTRNARTPMCVQVWAAEPTADTERWSHEVDIDLDVPDGRLVFCASGFAEEIPVEIPAGSYRARVSGAGYLERGDAGADGDDYYRLQFWPRLTDADPVLRKYWPGWAGYND
ncbi:hypothetical protein BDK92_7471 [Micromonospora pisi]|uniref:Uncharacterized protein n=2 Tax=Micromonospora pisi TaxID=589240 RepID=A0A495JWL6_9ACTN|nr:hypothetical protein BDK92_7471 [Micromonospora pisi]